MVGWNGLAEMTCIQRNLTSEQIAITFSWLSILIKVHCSTYFDSKRISKHKLTTEYAYFVFFIVKFSVSNALTIILEIAGLSYTLDYGLWHSKLPDWLSERFWELFHEMDTNDRSARIMRIIQENVTQNF